MQHAPIKSNKTKCLANLVVTFFMAILLPHSAIYCFKINENQVMVGRSTISEWTWGIVIQADLRLLA